MYQSQKTQPYFFPTPSPDDFFNGIGYKYSCGCEFDDFYNIPPDTCPKHGGSKISNFLYSKKSREMYEKLSPIRKWWINFQYKISGGM